VSLCFSSEIQIWSKDAGLMLYSTLGACEYVKGSHAADQRTSRAAILDLERTPAYTIIGALV
jgi:hypothetical protein